jgi:hypothetical protein
VRKWIPYTRVSLAAGSPLFPALLRTDSEQARETRVLDATIC